MDKTLLRGVYRQTFSKKGLVNNTSVLKELISFYGSEKRQLEWAASLEPWERKVLQLLAVSRSRGLRFCELRLAIPASCLNALPKLLNHLGEHFLVWKTSGDKERIVYRMFEEFCPHFLEEEKKPALKGLQVSFGARLDFHMCRLLSLIRLGKFRANAAGELHRRHKQICLSNIHYATTIFPKADESEFFLLMSFFEEKKWIRLFEEGNLELDESVYAYLSKNGFRLHQDFFHWWIQFRFSGERSTLLHLIKQMENGVAIENAVSLFWPFDPTVRFQEKTQAYLFEQLPRPLRELWFLGIVDFSLNGEKRIIGAQMNRKGFDFALSAQGESLSVTALPNFELFIPNTASPRLLFLASCLAVPENDEPFLRFRLEKERFQEAVGLGLSEEELAEFFDWTKPPPNVLSAMNEWAIAFFGASVFTGRILKIKDKSLWKDLSEFPLFMECVVEKIPNYGFLLHEKNEKEALSLLAHYGLTPPANENEEKGEGEIFTSKSLEANLIWPEETSPDYRMTSDEVDDGLIKKGIQKYGSDFHSLDLPSLVKALRHAKMTATFFSVRLKTKSLKLGEEKIYSVRSLRLSKEPFAAFVLERGKKEETLLELSQIKEIRLLHEKVKE